MTAAPLLFIHTGDSAYLRYTLTTARLFNPDSRIVLLGDAANRKYCGKEIEFHALSEIAPSPERQAFRELFVPIVGQAHGKEAWVQFVFERWFYLFDFIQAQGIDSFWTFDSDTMILTNLAALEPLYRKYDCTEQCNGMCVNGYLAHAEVAQGYVRKINELFARPTYLDQWRHYVGEHPDHAFTEMGAYATYRDEAGLKTFHLMTISDGAAFDDCICQQHEMEMWDPAVVGKPIKKLFVDNSGRLYVRHLPSQQFVRLHALNMSWAPEFLYPRILAQARRAVQVRSTSGDTNSLKLLHVKPTLVDRIGFRLRQLGVDI